MFTIKLLHENHFLKDPFSISLLAKRGMVIPVFLIAFLKMSSRSVTS
jgi:hypothetical protein